MTIYLASDHAGFELKQTLAQSLREGGIVVEDLGTHSSERADWADYGFRLACRVGADDTGARGIAVCGSGIGMSIVTNKVAGVRAALCVTPTMAEMSRRHNDANVLCLGARIVTPDQAQEIVETWLKTPFEGGRHAERLATLERLTGKNCR